MWNEVFFKVVTSPLAFQNGRNKYWYKIKVRKREWLVKIASKVASWGNFLASEKTGAFNDHLLLNTLNTFYTIQNTFRFLEMHSQRCYKYCRFTKVRICLTFLKPKIMFPFPRKCNLTWGVKCERLNLRNRRELISVNFENCTWMERSSRFFKSYSSNRKF